MPSERTLIGSIIWSPIHLPFLRAAAILSRVRSDMISRSNWANDKRMFQRQARRRARRIAHKRRLWAILRDLDISNTIWAA
jgi:hypothetical protein